MAGIILDHVTKVFSNGYNAVEETSLEIPDGEFMVLVGPSGSGKTTLLRMIAGLEEVSSGSILIGDRDVTQVPPEERDIAMVFQSYALYPNMTVRDNLEFGLKMRKMPKQERRERVDAVGKMLGLTPHLSRKPGVLSGGQRQRVAMGRAMVREPQVYLMDEPLSNLDAKLRVGMRASLSELHQRIGVTTVYVTHDQIEATTLGQRVAVLSQARLQQCDTPEVLYNEPANLFVASFIGSPMMNLVEAEISNGSLHFAGHAIPLPLGIPSELPKKVIFGFRPTDLHLVALGIPGAWPRLRVSADIVEEQGADSVITFAIDALPVNIGLRGERTEQEQQQEERILVDDKRARLAARVSGRAHVAVGEQIELAIDPAHLYFFDPETGSTLKSRGN
jgi:multiple sugar transport system ATP-binding protein